MTQKQFLREKRCKKMIDSLIIIKYDRTSLNKKQIVIKSQIFINN